MLSQTFKAFLISVLLLSAGRLWADDSGVGSQIEDDQESETSALDSWQEGWQEDEKGDGWTWFGMGYESRRGSSANHSATSPGGTNKGSGGNGGPKGGGGRGR